MKRRSLMRLAAAGGASVAGFLLPGSPQVVAAMTGARPAPRIPAQATDPNFASGTVISLEPTGAIVSWGAGQRAIRVSSFTSFWKETTVDFGSVELGDNMDAVGKGRPDGTLDATSVWLNIGRFDGHVEATRRGGITIRTLRQHLWDIEFSPYLEVVGPDGASVRGAPPSLQPGQRVGGVVVRLRDGRRRATRIWLS